MATMRPQTEGIAVQLQEVEVPMGQGMFRIDATKTGSACAIVISVIVGLPCGVVCAKPL